MSNEPRLQMLGKLIDRLRSDGRSPVNFYKMMAKAEANIRHEMQNISPLETRHVYLSMMLGRVQNAKFESPAVERLTEQEIQAQFKILFGE